VKGIAHGLRVAQHPWPLCDPLVKQSDQAVARRRLPVFRSTMVVAVGGRAISKKDAAEMFEDDKGDAEGGRGVYWSRSP
jgi:hypothetical protein